MKKIAFILLGIITSFQFANSQELRCEVTVNSNQVAQVNRSIFDALEKGVFEFMNNTKWTDDNFDEKERIECGIFINVTEQLKDGSGKVVSDQYKATILVQSRRPVYNTALNCQMLNYMDQDFEFTYVPFQPFNYSESSSMSNLTAVLAFYAQMIIGMDYDSFELNGGEKALNKALQIVNNSQSLAERGWQAMQGNENRYWMINDYLNSAFVDYRAMLYEYHRLGFDVMQKNLPEGRQAAINALKSVDKIWMQRPNAFLLKVFYSTKRNEIINMLKSAPANDKVEIIPILKKTDPSQGSMYDAAAN